MPGFEMTDYKEVAERLRDLFAKHPEASMRGTYEFVDGHVIYRAECYRTPDDPAPGVGTAWEEVPGRTPYTKGSELQNAETSAWGRAIVAVGASESKRIASADEMRLANDRRSAPSQPPREMPPSPERIETIIAAVTDADLGEWVKAQGFPWPWPDGACNIIEREVARVNDLRRAGKPAERVMTRAESKANEAAKAEAEPTHCPECGAGPLEPHAEECSLSPF